MKTIALFVFVISTVACSASTDPTVEPDTSNFNSPDNSNVDCVVNGQTFTCNANTWSYTDNLGGQVGCSDYGVCRNGQRCVLFNGDVGTCLSH